MLRHQPTMRWVCRGALGIASMGPLWAAPLPQDCDATIDVIAFPARTINEVPIGLAGGASYSASALVTPQPIPIGLDATDYDRVRSICDQICKLSSSSSDWDADWSLTSATGDPGAFLDANAAKLNTALGYWHVLYLPPDDLVEGETREIQILAALSDLSTVAADPASFVSFDVTVFRDVDDPEHMGVRRYDVDVELGVIIDPTVPPPACQNTTQICELLGPQRLTTPEPFGSITRSPAGMVLGEIRPFDCEVFDLDTVNIECGTPEGYEPVVSNFATETVDDGFESYTWSVQSGPGSGTFIRQGRSALFQATGPGIITVQVDAMTGDGEIFTEQTQFEIHLPMLKGVEFAGNEDVARDLDGQVYAGYDWYDFDNDGLADKPDPAMGNGANLTGDRSFPVAYVPVDSLGSGQHLSITKVIVECGVTPMPGAILRGNIAGLPAGQLLGPAELGTPASHLTAESLYSKDPIPDFVGRVLDQSITWEVSFGGGTWVETGESENDFYLLGGEPDFGPYAPFETMYDIACRAQPGSRDRVQMALGVWSAFVALSTQRKQEDGHFNADGQVMNYWRILNGNCQTVDGMLSDPEGDGSCRAWAQLLKGSLGAHGIVADGYRITSPDPGSPYLLVNNWREINPQGPGQPWTLFVDVSPYEASGSFVVGIPGQDNPTPHKTFDSHFIVFLDGFFLDPSYGTGPYGSAVNHENSAFWGISNNTVGFQNTPLLDLNYAMTAL